MTSNKKTEQQQHEPHGRRDRDSAFDRPRKRHDYAAGADGEQDVDARAAEKADTMEPDKDGTGW